MKQMNNPIMNALTFMATKPIPETFLFVPFKLFRYISSRMSKKPIADSRFRFQCIGISVFILLIIFILTGSSNPLTFLFDIPLSDVAEIQTKLGPERESLSTAYYLFCLILTALGTYFIKTFLFNSQNVSFFCINGLLFHLMSLLVAALMSCFSERIILSNIFDDVENFGCARTFIFILVLYCILYFTLHDALSDIFSAIVSLGLIPLVCHFIPGATSNRFLVLLIVSVILTIILEILDAIGVWNPIIAFLTKWFFTPQYLFPLSLKFGLYLILFICKMHEWEYNKKS